MDTDRKKSIILYKHIFIVRQIMNILFPRLYSKYCLKLQNINYDDLLETTNFMKRKNIINEDNGSKLALVILCDKIQIDGLSKELCKFYLDLNDKFHPKIIPLKKSIPKLEELQQVITTDTQFCGIKITTNIIQNLIKQLEENKVFFQ
jgi:hypothetical protein